MARKPKSPRDAEITPIPAERIERQIYLIRGEKVMLDSDLAALYQVPTFRLNEAVKRNAKRFPADFMFQLTAGEAESLTSQIAMSKFGRGGENRHSSGRHKAIRAASKTLHHGTGEAAGAGGGTGTVAPAWATSLAVITTGGPPVTLCDISSNSFGGSWNR